MASMLTSFSARRAAKESDNAFKILPISDPNAWYFFSLSCSQTTFNSAKLLLNAWVASSFCSQVITGRCPEAYLCSSMTAYCTSSTTWPRFFRAASPASRSAADKIAETQCKPRSATLTSLPAWRPCSASFAASEKIRRICPRNASGTAAVMERTTRMSLAPSLWALSFAASWMAPRPAFELGSAFSTTSSALLCNSASRASGVSLPCSRDFQLCIVTPISSLVHCGPQRLRPSST
mmetsp:Transcript_120352/g.208902  ORF Transcript_120352/g.208902 Transcript_120352/m.208902 type:complete len:236 (-) Transcript_120352:191-898(-)